MNIPHPEALKKYNATIVKIKPVTDRLSIFTVKPDFEKPDFLPGQFITAGLGSWEERHPDCQKEVITKPNQLGRRAYSVCSPVFNNDGSLHDHNACDSFELYITLVVEGKDESHAPFLTPRLFNLEEDDRLWVNKKIVGHYILENIDTSDDIIFLATGTGQAPHNAMVSQLLRNNHEGRILIMECNRTFDMFGYTETLNKLAEQYENVFYRQLATREGNDRCRIQQFIRDGRVKSEFDIDINPNSTRVFLCGNPDMIGIPKFKDNELIFDTEGGAVEMLVKDYGLSIHHGHTPGRIHYEKYW